MATPLVSIITPSYNRAYILPLALKSVQAQTYSNWELILIDDGSTDNTKAVAEQFNDPRIRYIYQENQGQTVARNRGLREARGEWIAYLDSDNALEPNYLSDMLAEIGKHPDTLWAFPRGYRYLELWEDGKLVSQKDMSDQFPENVTPVDIAHWNFKTDMNGFMHSRKVLEDGVRFDEDFRYLEDWEFMLTFARECPDNFLYVDKPLYTYWQRYGGDGIVSQASYRSIANAFEQVYQKHKDDPLMAGQTWYPSRVEKWNRLADEYEAGKLPPFSHYYFQSK